MPIRQAFHSWLRRGRWSRQSATFVGRKEPIGSEAMIRAFGDCLSLLATILEREGVMNASELARLLDEFATVTAVDRPEQGKIIMFWATYLEETAATLLESPPLH